jgi:hypothetical protein
MTWLLLVNIGGKGATAPGGYGAFAYNFGLFLPIFVTLSPVLPLAGFLSHGRAVLLPDREKNAR